MNRRGLILILVALLLAGMLALPGLLRAIPSRYVARLPEPLQQLGAPRDQAPILPTVASSDEAGFLLQVDAVTIGEAVLTPTATKEFPQPSFTPERKNDPAPTAEPKDTSTPTATPSPTATATATPTPIPFPPKARLEGFVHTFQTWNNCGPATLAMTLSYFGLQLSQTQTAAVLKPNPEDRNVSPYEMVSYVWKETPFQAIARVNGNLDTVRRLVSHGMPVILEIGIEPPGEFRWLGWYGHYLLVVAYDDEAQQFWVYDSWFGTSEEPLQNQHADGRILPYSVVAEFWPHFNRSYIAVYRPEQAAEAAAIIGADMDDEVMWQNALMDVRAETAASPDNAFHWFNLGTIYNALGRYEEAAIAFDEARSIGLPWRMLWYQFGPYEAYYRVGRYDDVLLLAEVTLQDRPYFEESYYYRGLAQAAMGDRQGGRQSLQQAIDFNPNFTPARTALDQMDDQ